jgi:hypothetical protein
VTHESLLSTYFTWCCFHVTVEKYAHELVKLISFTKFSFFHVCLVSFYSQFSTEALHSPSDWPFVSWFLFDYLAPRFEYFSSQELWECCLFKVVLHPQVIAVYRNNAAEHMLKYLVSCLLSLGKYKGLRNIPLPDK